MEVFILTNNSTCAKTLQSNCERVCDLCYKRDK